MTKLFVICQDSTTRAWVPVGKLTTVDGDGLYKFSYTKGANKIKNFTPFGRMADLSKNYYSDKLFPLFRNRLLSPSRPEYKDYIQWLGLSEDSATPLEVLSRSGGIKQTDSLAIYSCPEPDANDRYNTFFFAHGIRHLPEETKQFAKSIKTDTPLFPMFDVKNPHDPNAVALRTDDPSMLVGYIPRFIARDAKRIFEKSDSQQEIELNVAQVNTRAPLQFRFLCKLSAPWPQDFTPCCDEDFTPLSDTSD